MLSAGSNQKSHTGVLSVAKGLMNKWLYEHCHRSIRYKRVNLSWRITLVHIRLHDSKLGQKSCSITYELWPTSPASALVVLGHITSLSSMSNQILPLLILRALSCDWLHDVMQEITSSGQFLWSFFIGDNSSSLCRRWSEKLDRTKINNQIVFTPSRNI